MELLKYNKLGIGGRLALNKLTGSLCYFNTMLQMLLSTNTTYDILMKYPKYFSKTKVGLALYNFMKDILVDFKYIGVFSRIALAIGLIV